MTWKYCVEVECQIIEISFERGHHCYVGNCYLLWRIFWQSKRTCFREWTILPLLVHI